MNYWQSRTLNSQERLTEKTVKETEKQLAKYYDETARKLKGRFLLTYKTILSSIDEGMKPTPADLYRLDKYWALEAAMAEELKKLGRKQASLYYTTFINHWKDIYESIALTNDNHFKAYDEFTISAMIEQVWCADGKSWSERIWDNTAKLQQALNDELLDCVLMGRSPDQLKDRLMYEFGVSYNRADTLVRTEITHIHANATIQRYKDAGIEWVQVYASKDERRCKICGALHLQRFRINEPIPVPAHPKCRCRVIAVVDGLEAVNEQPKYYYPTK